MMTKFLAIVSQITAPLTRCRQGAIQRSAITAAVLLIGGVVMQSASAHDLWNLYQAAERTNGNWAGQQFDYLANQKNEALARGDLLPQAALQSSITRNQFDPDNNALANVGNTASQIGVGFSQALFRVDKWTTYEKAKLASQANTLQLAQQHQQLTEQIIKAYLAALQTEAMTESLTAEYNALKAQDDMMQARLQQGVVARVDTQETRARLESVKALLANNEVAITNAKQQLALLTGQPVETLDPLKTMPDVSLVPAKSIENWLNLAQTQNLDIQLAQTQSAIANKQVDFLRSNLYPRVDLVGNVGWQNNSSRLQSNSDGTNYSIGVQLDFPFYTGGRTRTGLEQGTLQAQAANSRLGYIYQSVMTQTSQAYLNVMAQKATITAQQVAVNANAQVAEASKAGYDLGVRSMVDTLLAQRQYYAARRDLINAYFDYLTAYVDLQKATGNLTAQTVQVIDGLLR